MSPCLSEEHVGGVPAYLSDARDHPVSTKRYEEDPRDINSKRIFTDWWERVRTLAKA